MSEVKILSKRTIQEIFNLDLALQAVEDAYRGKADGSGDVWPMVFHEFDPGHADLDIKSGNLDASGIYGLKVVSWYEKNPEVKLPALFGTSLIFDIKTGEPMAMLNAGPITDLRTGAAGAIGAKYLARKDSRKLLMVGCGELSAYLIAATLRAMPQLTEVVIVNPNHPGKAVEACERIKEKVQKLLGQCKAELTASLEGTIEIENAVRTSDIILTATPSRAPMIPREWVNAGTHFSCVGSDMSGKQEIATEILRDARVFGDDTMQCLSVGECEIPFKNGALTELQGEIGEVLCGKKAGRTSDQELTVFDSTGIALQDLSSAAIILQIAKERGLGMDVEL